MSGVPVVRRKIKPYVRRGRIYCEPMYLNYQSNELAKSLIIFSKGEEISRNNLTAIEFYKAHCVNCFGNGWDKKSYLKKLGWFKHNEADILNLSKADKKYLFLAFCLEYKRFHDFYHSDRGDSFLCNLPLQLDATCNGYQHLTLLSNETKALKVLNLDKSNKKQNPEDFYEYIAMQLPRILYSKLENLKENTEQYESVKRLMKLTINRKSLKIAVMTMPYNASSHTLQKSIRDKLIKVD